LIVSIFGNKIVWFEFLSPELQAKIRQELEKYPRSRFRRDAYEVDEHSPMGQLLSAINYLVDLHGAKAIDWINEKDLKELLGNKNLKKAAPEPRQRTKHPMEFYENALIRFGGGDFNELKNNPDIEILYAGPSYLAATEFALKYLRENNANKRLYISSCREWNTNVVWIRR